MVRVKCWLRHRCHDCFACGDAMRYANLRSFKSLCFVFALVLGCVSQLLSAAENDVQKFFDGLRSLSADFQQQVVDMDGVLVQQSEGRMMLQRPGQKFRWDYLLPYRQLIVADGETLWIYDEDLEQVTRSRLDRALGDTPAMLLGSERPLTDNFDISVRELDGDLQWFSLLPKQEKTNFTHIRLGFSGHVLQRMELIDGFENTTLLSFSNIQRNLTVKPEQFRFIPPPNVDVVGDFSIEAESGLNSNH